MAQPPQKRLDELAETPERIQSRVCPTAQDTSCRFRQSVGLRTLNACGLVTGRQHPGRSAVQAESEKLSDRLPRGGSVSRAKSSGPVALKGCLLKFCLTVEAV